MCQESRARWFFCIFLSKLWKLLGGSCPLAVVLSLLSVSWSGLPEKGRVSSTQGRNGCRAIRATARRAGRFQGRLIKGQKK